MMNKNLSSNDTEYKAITPNNRHIQLIESTKQKILDVLLKKDMGEYDEINSTALRKFLLKNQNTSVGKDFNFKNILEGNKEGIISRFKDSIPLTTYTDYDKYINHVLDGNTNVLGLGQAEFISLTGGTTGKRKLIPNYSYSASNIPYAISAFHTYAFMANQIPLDASFINLVSPLDLDSCEKTKYGAPIGFISSIMQKDDTFNRDLTLTLEKMPYEVKKIKDIETRWFIQGLFSLNEKTIAYIYSMFPSSIIAWVNFIKEHWSVLIDCLSSKQLPQESKFKLKIQGDYKEEIEKELISRIDLNRVEFLRNMDKNLIFTSTFILNVWPHFKFAQTCVTGSYFHYKKILSESYGIEKVFTLTYAASEFFGGNNFFHESNLFIPHRETHFEFIPFNEIKNKSPQTISEFSQLIENKKYEVVITSLISGFFRYRTGDILEIKISQDDDGNRTPQFNIIGRDFANLNIADEMTQEFHIYRVISDFIQMHNKNYDYKIELGMFSRAIENLRYVFYFEFREDYYIDDLDKNVIKNTANDSIDFLLRNENYTYNIIREDNAIKLPIVNFIKKGSITEHMLERSKKTGGDINQNKPSLILNNKDKDFFNRRILF